MKLRSERVFGPPPRQSVRRPLTKQNLRAFNENNEPPNYESGDSSQSLNGSESSESSESTPSSTDPMFPTLLKECGVYFRSPRASPPADLAAVLSDLRRERNQDELREQTLFQRLCLSHNEETYKVHFINALFNPSTGEALDEYSMQMDLEWTAVLPRFAAEMEFPSPKPDYFEAFSWSQYPRKARDALDWYVSPSSHPVTMPTFCVEFKGPDKGSRHVVAQAAHDGAVMVDAAWEIHKYMKKPARDFFGKTKALVITIGDTFQLFACHAMPADWNQDEDEYPSKLDYHVFRLVGVMIASEDDLKTICPWMHNARDWCRARAESVKNDLWKYFEFANVREEGNVRTKERKRNGAWLAQDQQDRPAKRLKT